MHMNFNQQPNHALQRTRRERSALRAYSLRLHSFRLLPKGSSVASRGQMEQQCRCTAQRMLGR